MKKAAILAAATILTMAGVGIATAQTPPGPPLGGPNGAPPNGGPPPGHGPAEFLKRMDTNGDGTITKAEFTAANLARAEEMFSRMDKNGDGVITKDEIEQLGPPRAPGAPGGPGAKGSETRPPR